MWEDILKRKSGRRGKKARKKRKKAKPKLDCCAKKVKRTAKVWPSAYASGRVVQCRKKGCANYGNSSK